MIEISEYQNALDAGYWEGAPRSAEKIDKPIAERDPCPECGGSMEYKPVMKKDSYRAFVLCRICGYETEF